MVLAAADQITPRAADRPVPATAPHDFTLADYIAGKLAFVAHGARADIADIVRFLAADGVEPAALRAATRYVADQIAEAWAAIEHGDAATAADGAALRRAARDCATRADRAGLARQITLILCWPQRRDHQLDLIARSIEQHRRADANLVTLPTLRD
jgi:hypothetical protein